MKNGRPFAPKSAAECRERISYEVAGKGRKEKLRQWHRLLKSFVEAEQADREDRRIAVIAEANALKREELALKKADYLLRFTSKTLGQQAILRQNQRLLAENERLKMLVGSNPIAGHNAA
jgi:hypothetical protein